MVDPTVCARSCCPHTTTGGDYCSTVCRSIDRALDGITTIGRSSTETAKAVVAEARAGGLGWLDIRAR